MKLQNALIYNVIRPDLRRSYDYQGFLNIQSWRFWSTPTVSSIQYMPTIVHFENPSDDIERSKKFYNDFFGWKFDKFPSPPGSKAMPEGMEYWLISTVDDKGDEALGGGMMKRQMPNSKELQTILT